ncbi:MAG: hypothetical protein R2769_07960 [Saprospiraceae bacterium]
MVKYLCPKIIPVENINAQGDDYCLFHIDFGFIDYCTSTSDQHYIH